MIYLSSTLWCLNTLTLSEVNKLIGKQTCKVHFRTSIKFIHLSTEPEFLLWVWYGKKTRTSLLKWILKSRPGYTRVGRHFPHPFDVVFETFYVRLIRFLCVDMILVSWNIWSVGSHCPFLQKISLEGQNSFTSLSGQSKLKVKKCTNYPLPMTPNCGNVRPLRTQVGWLWWSMSYWKKSLSIVVESLLSARLYNYYH